MPGKFAQLPLRFIAIGLLVDVSVTASFAAKPPGPDKAYTIEAIDRVEAQNSAASSYTFGITVGDIYDLGVMVLDVDLGSRARQIGIRRDDVILAVNDEQVWDTGQFQKLVEFFAGGPIDFTVSRLGEVFIVDVR